MQTTPSNDCVVTIQWENQAGHWWNETCADIMEVFGLPGDRYISKPTADFMTFTFKNKKDADLCKVLISEKI